MSKAIVEKLKVYFVGVNDPLIVHGDDAILLRQEISLRPEERINFRYLDHEDGKSKDLYIFAKQIAYCDYYDAKS